VSITRAEVLRRAHSVWPEGKVPYSQSRIHLPDGYRQDCSGFVCMSWGVPLNAPGSWGGLNTVNLVTDGWMHKIDPNDLKPGDAIGLCGPGTGGNDGHIQLFTAWYNTDPNNSDYWCLEQFGGTSGPQRRLHHWPSNYKAYRYKDIIDDPVSPAPTSSPQPRAFPLSYPPNVYGLLTGPSWMHGGYYANEQSVIADIQRHLISAGCVSGISNISSGWVDGKYGSHTMDAVKVFQRRHNLEDDGLVGPRTWAALMR
jgi:peptidoglycan hydrolase-like protein with peptidoglycan-binding domain